MLLYSKANEAVTFSFFNALPDSIWIMQFKVLYLIHAFPYA